MSRFGTGDCDWRAAGCCVVFTSVHLLTSTSLPSPRTHLWRRVLIPCPHTAFSLSWQELQSVKHTLTHTHAHAQQDVQRNCFLHILAYSHVHTHTLKKHICTQINQQSHMHTHSLLLTQLSTLQFILKVTHIYWISTDIQIPQKPTQVIVGMSHRSFSVSVSVFDTACLLHTHLHTRVYLSSCSCSWNRWSWRGRAVSDSAPDTCDPAAWAPVCFSTWAHLSGRTGKRERKKEREIEQEREREREVLSGPLLDLCLTFLHDYTNKTHTMFRS